MFTYILANDLTEGARRSIDEAGGCVIQLRERSPRVLLVSLPAAIYHGKHEEGTAQMYTLDTKTGYGICYYDPDPLSRCLYRWHERDGAEGIGSDGALTRDRATLRQRLAEQCKAILSEPVGLDGTQWFVQQGRIIASLAVIVGEVLPLLPDDLRGMITPALTHWTRLIPADDDEPGQSDDAAPPAPSEPPCRP